MAPTTLHLGGRTLVLVAGMPGAGKSTLLGTLEPDPAVVVLDSDAHRAALREVLRRAPYPLYRPLVHLWHRLSVVVAAASSTPAVVVHLPATCARTRSLVAGLAAAIGRDPHLLWCHAEPAEARRGQLDRGRVVPVASEGWAGVTVVDRSTARAGLRIAIGAPLRCQ